jgi:hypothetical protein
MDFAHLTILSFHASNGDRINTTTTAANPQVLLPVINRPIGNCRNQAVRFMRVQCILNFTPLTTIDPYPVSPILRVLYYIKLPQGSRPMLNGNNQGYTLVSFLGPDDLCLLPPNVMKATILEPVLQDGPVLLGPSDFNLQDVNTNSSGIGMEIDRKILKLVWHQLCAAIFNELCPGYVVSRS